MAKSLLLLLAAGLLSSVCASEARRVQHVIAAKDMINADRVKIHAEGAATLGTPAPLAEVEQSSDSTTTSFPLGIGNGCVPPEHLTATSALQLAGGDFSAPRARLELSAEPARHIGWRPAKGDAGAYWQVDLGREYVLTSIATQGGHDLDESSRPANSLWTASYRLTGSLDGLTWDDIAGAVSGNADADTVVTRDLGVHALEPARFRFVRVHPLQCGAVVSQEGHTEPQTYDAATAGFMCALRVELYGFPACGPSCARRAAPLGLEDGTIPDSSISASSTLAPVTPAAAARLHAAQRFFREGGWSPACPLVNGVKACSHRPASAPPDYLQVDLGRELEINAVATQGAASRGAWVTQYFLAFSNDGRHWAQTAKEFVANADAAQVVKVVLPRPVLARYVRITPTAWNEPEEEYGLRWELYGPEGYRPEETGCRLQRPQCPCGDNSLPIAPHEAPGTRGQCACGAAQVQHVITETLPETADAAPAHLRGNVVVVPGPAAM